MTRSCRSECLVGDQLLDDLRDRVGGGADRAGARRASERAHAAHDDLRPLARQQRHERLLRDDQRVAAHDDLALAGEIERHDRDVLDVDVVPDVELGPVRQRKHAHALARAEAAVQQVPELGPLPLGIPLALGVAQREDALLRPRFLFVAARAAEGRVEVAGLQAVEQRRRLEQRAAALRAEGERLRAGVERLLVGVHDQAGADFRGIPVAEGDHLPELVAGVDVQQRERNRAGIERLLRQAEQDRRVLADRVEHHRPLELGDDLAQDVDALGLERAQVVEARRRHDVGRGRSRPRRLAQAKQRRARGARRSEAERDTDIYGIP